MSAVASVKAMINGTEYTLTYNSSTDAYEASITAPTTTSWNETDHVFPVSVTAVDVAGNSTTVDADDETFGDSLKLRVKETTKPVVVFMEPTTGSLLGISKPTIRVRVTDDGSGVDLSSFVLNLGSKTVTADDCEQSAIDNGYDLTYVVETALADGSHTFTASIGDNDGNTSDTASVTITVDTAAPELSVSTPENNSYTNNPVCVVSGIASDDTSDIVLTVNGAEVVIGENGAFSTEVTLNEGENTIEVIVADAGGKTTTITRTVTLDTSAPVFTEVIVAPNPVDAGKTYTISVKVAS